ncbi:hypothetical protein CXB51_024976 [Gossypium anomalum]|uniref:AAA+ ATPase domain-containing protein n=1 Tax=Gossypium anomalum TaxID=47600 RepID=A0A8J6CQU5_9ROSI|nr:hypothetical protein CXB51_024976 [Gossypium anomalum]
MYFHNCSSLKYIFTPFILLGLKQLKQVGVKECSSMEQVIRDEEEKTVAHKFTFPSLFSITIDLCFNLTNFYLGKDNGDANENVYLLFALSMEFVIGIVSSIVTKAAEHTISPIINHVKYLSDVRQNVETLNDQTEKLKGEKETVQRSVDAELRSGKEIRGDVKNWLSAVDRMIPKQEEKVTQDEEKAKKKCFLGLCPNIWTRYKLSLEAAEKAKAVAKLLEQSKFPEVAYRVALQDIPVPPVKGYEEFESRTSVLNDIMEALKDDSVSVLGVHGMGGIGKTMLVKEIASKVKGKLFDSVVIATVTQAIDVEKIQNQIADLLDLKLEEQSMVGKALRLRERLKKEERILVVLDDIWAKIDIEEVGIPLGDEHKGCKLLLTSRELNVLSNGMDAQKCFPIGFLNELEAWDLFKKKAGDCVEGRDLEPTARDVAKKCAGLPIAIATVAGALRNKELCVWKNALRELERHSSSTFTEITAVRKLIELSFKYLGSEEVKQTFLLCSVMGRNGLVEDLVRYTVGLDLFGGVNTMEEARNNVLTVVDKLKASSLLLDGFEDGLFDIHDVVWDAALNIASRDYHMHVLRDYVPKEKMNSWRMISLSPRIIAELPKEMECSGLSFFHMALDDSVEIPPHFFRRIESLKVLALPYMRSYPCLPESINHLIDLRMLCLRGWQGEDITIIAIIGELKNLEILDLAWSSIKELPKEIAQLTRLRLLDLSWCRELEIIPPNVLSSLSKLEELYMERSLVKWENEGAAGNERRNACLDELNNLFRLTTLRAHIPDVQMILKHRFIEKLDRYRILIGDYNSWEWNSKYEYSRTLKLKIYRNISSNNGVKMLLKKTEDLYLDLNGLEGIKSVLAELNSGEEVSSLKRVDVIIRMKESESIPLFNKQFSFISFADFLKFKKKKKSYYCTWVLIKHVFPNLEQLELRLLSDEDQFPPNLFQQVKVLKVNGGYCGGFPVFPFLRKINAESLDLEDFRFRDELPCKGDFGTPSRIKKIEIRMWRKDSELDHILSNLQTLTIHDCDDLINIGAFSLSFKNLTTLTVSCCAMMTNLVTPFVVESLVQLTTMEVHHCIKMTEIVAHVGDYHRTIVVGKLKCLKLSYLQSLTSFCPGSYTFNFPCLEEVVVKRCPKLKIFLNGVLNTPQLPQLQRVKQGFLGQKECWTGDLNTNIQQLYIQEEKALTISDTFPELEIWQRNPREILELHNIKRMEFYKCSTLMYIFTPFMLLSLKQLLQIEVKECSIMEQVIREDEEEATTHELKFPQLFHVKMESCSNLTNFYLGSRALKFPSLISITIADCPKMTALSSSISKRSEKVIGEQDVEDNTAALFCDKVLIPNLQWLLLFSINIHKIWHHPSSSSLTHLTYLPVEGCHNLKYLFPSFLVKDLVQLHNLKIEDCNMMEQVIFTDGLGAEDQWRNHTIFSKLEWLSLEDLPKLKGTCFENEFEFPCLRGLTLKNCPLLKTFISKSVSGDEPQIHQPTQTNDSAVLNQKVVFPNLENLHIQNCDSLEEIIELQGLTANESLSTSATRSTMAETVMTKFVFLHVRNLVLDKVRSLNMHTTQWPSLEQMKVIECPKAQIFGEVEIPNQQPLFCVNEDTFPVLQELTLKTSDMMKGICDGQLSLQCFPNLKLLNLQFFPGTSTTLPYSFISSLPNLQKLVISNASISEMVRSEGLSHKERHTSAFSQLKELSLSELPEMTLKTFEPSLLSFKNLTTLEVSKCHGFINLMACSTAKSLTLLERLSIADCELIEEITSCEGEDLQGSIVFPKLKCLKLSHLPSLASFSLAHHSLEFPVLQMVILTECPKMKNFCHGELSTPRLEQMHLTRDEDGELQWEGDLNTTIKHMFDEMNVQNSQVVEVTDQLHQMEKGNILGCLSRFHVSGRPATHQWVQSMPLKSL